MTAWNQLRSWVLALAGRSRMEREMDTELRFHLEARADDLVRSGVAREAALRRARLEFGGLERTKEECRDARGTNLFENFIQDLRYGLRTLGKNPGFTGIAVTTLALGIAVNATMFSLVSAYLMRPPAVHDAEHVAVVSSIDPSGSFQADAYPVSVPNYLAWREANHVFQEIAAADEGRTITFTAAAQSGSKGEPEALPSAAVSANYFRVLGVSAQFGRTFSDGEDQPGHASVVVLSRALWERQFGSGDFVAGRVVRLNRENYTVIGVMPASFQLMGFTPRLWTPLVLKAADQTAAARKDRSLRLFARMRPGATLGQARAEMVALGRRAEENFPDMEKGWGVAVRTLPDFLVYGFGIRTALAVMMTTVGFVLLIACANVGGLLLARGASRRKELAIRVSLGAGRLRIVRQLLTEGLVIALLGGAAGLLLADWGVKIVRANMTFNEAVSAIPINLDRNVLLFALGISVASALLCALAPALKATRSDVQTDLKDESRAATASRSHSRLRMVMVTGEVALALLLLVGSGLLIRGLFLIQHQNLGFRPDHLLTASVTLDEAQYKDASKQTAFVREVISRLHQIPGTEAVAATSDLPATGPGSVTFRMKGQPELPPGQQLTTLDNVVTPEFFEAARIPLLNGREFAETDNAAAPRVVLVNEKFASKYLQNQEPLGKQIQLGLNGATPEWSEIVGVVGDVKTYSEATRTEPQVYEPFLQKPGASFSLMVRTGFDPSSVAPALRNAVEQADSELPLARVMSMPAVIEFQRMGDSLFEQLLGSFALLALILAAIGIYGLIAYSVGQRTHEIGIRMALGAGKGQVLGMVLWQGLKMAAIGAAVGLALALPLPKLFEAIFYDLHLQERWLYFVVPVVMILIAMAATYIPARRATRVDPLVALRYE